MQVLLEIRDFVSGNLETIELHTPANGHNGSDMSMMHDFVRMVGEEERVNRQLLFPWRVI